MTGGGPGAAVATNSNSATVNDRGAAIAQSGLSNVQGPVTSGGTGEEGRRRSSATSGGAFATGLIAQNSVTNVARASVHVNGQNHANITVQSTNSVAVTNSGAASAVSGTALTATNGGADLHASAAVNPGSSTAIGPRQTYASARATSADVANTGLSVSNVSSGSLKTTVSGASGPINISQTENATITNDGQAGGVTAGTCAGATCYTTSVSQSLALIPPGTTQAKSGTASAVGLQAQNTVNTNANVNVRVQGSNYGVIQVVVQTITGIVNWGSAQAQSGIAAITGGASPPATGSGASIGQVQATSGNARVTGASVSNQVRLSSSTSIQINGDNFNPIHVLVTFLVNLANHGVASAASGRAQADAQHAPLNGAVAPSGLSSSGGASSVVSATSGTASALGLQAQNLVDLASNLTIDISGSNYAPIDVEVLFGTQIENSGQAQATTGQALASSTTSSPTASSPTSTSSSPQPSPTTVAEATTARASAMTSAATATASGSLIESHTGSATASSVVSSVNAINQQISSVAAPGSSESVAANSATYLVQTRGQASAVTGNASTGPIPTPALVSGQATVSQELGGRITLQREPGPNGNVGLTVGSPSQSQASAADSNVDLSLWGTLPDPGLPLMPDPVLPGSRTKQSNQQATTSTLYPVGIVEGPGEAPMPEATFRTPSGNQGSTVTAPAGSAAGPRTAPAGAPARPAVAPVPSRENSTARLIVVGLLLAVATVGVGYAWRRRAWLSARIESSLPLIHLPGAGRPS